ncbi:MAG: hypothetical protein HFE80_10275 [Clostridiaceae bacterium]|jgi:hypothetical protein|nr:hypothetical protein [Clostridiaceae bacterium]
MKRNLLLIAQAARRIEQVSVKRRWFRSSGLIQPVDGAALSDSLPQEGRFFNHIPKTEK